MERQSPFVSLSNCHRMALAAESRPLGGKEWEGARLVTGGRAPDFRAGRGWLPEPLHCGGAWERHLFSVRGWLSGAGGSRRALAWHPF